MAAKDRSLILLFPFLFGLDILFGFVVFTSFILIVKTLLLLSFVILFARKNIFKLRFINYFIYYLGFVLILSILTNGLHWSWINLFIQITAIFFMYYVGYGMNINSGHIIIMRISMLIMLVASIYSISVLAGLGKYVLVSYQYSTDLLNLGTLGAQNIYILALSVVFSFIYLMQGYYNNQEKIIIVILLIASVFINIFVMRRTSIFIIGAGILSSLLLSKSKSKVLFSPWTLITLLLIPIIIIFSWESIMDRFSLRESRFDPSMENISAEGRYVEVNEIIDRYQRSELDNKLLGSFEFFDTREFGEDIFKRERPIHTDYGILLYSTGIIGVLLFLIVFLNLLNKTLKHKSLNSPYSFVAKYILTIILILSFFLGFSGAVLRHTTFTAFIFFSFGLYMRILDSDKYLIRSS